MVYFPLILTFAQRWVKDFGLGSLMAVMLPYSVAFSIAGAILTGIWAAAQIPLGPGEGVTYQPPAQVEAAQPLSGAVAVTASPAVPVVTTPPAR